MSSSSPTSSDATLPVNDTDASLDPTTVAASHSELFDKEYQTGAEKPWLTSIPEQPITQQRKPFIKRKDEALSNAGTARAVIAASRESPNGTIEDDYVRKHEKQTVIQQHCEYWDTDHDGIIWPFDTYVGCRKWGWSPPLAALATFIINFNLSYPTCPGILPDPFFRIWLDRVYKDKHGSDSMTFDNEGRFKPQNFEDIFAKYDRGDKGGLSLGDLWGFWRGQRMVFDFFGWSATVLECECFNRSVGKLDRWCENLRQLMMCDRDSSLSADMARRRGYAERGYTGCL